MHFNDKELAAQFTKPATIEGRLHYQFLTVKPKVKGKGYKEYWFKVVSNLLFYYGLNSFGGIKREEPVGVLVLENCTVKVEENADVPFAFSVTYLDDPSKVHIFACKNLANAQQWVTVLRVSGYEHLRLQLQMLRAKILSFSGKDPLRGNGQLKSNVFLSTPADTLPRQIGPKQSTFQSHVVTNLNERNGSTDSKNEDLIQF